MWKLLRGLVMLTCIAQTNRRNDVFKEKKKHYSSGKVKPLNEVRRLG